MGLTQKRLLIFSSLFLTSFPVFAVPRLRLSSTVVGPISVAQGSSPQVVEVDAFAPVNGENNSDNELGTLRLTLSSSASWVSAAAGASRSCRSREGDCLPIRLTFSTQSLATGRYSATVTASDANAIDAPQRIVVIVNVGGGVPQFAVNLFLPTSNSIDEFTFYTANNPPGQFIEAQKTEGGDWLTLFLAPAASFDFLQTHRIRARFDEERPLAAGTYRGTVVIRLSPVAAENRSVPVNLTVTANPIANPSEERLRVRLAENSPDLVKWVSVFNRGRGSLTMSGVTATAENSGTWLKAEQPAGTKLVVATFSSKGLTPGIFRGSIAVASNAANSPLAIPVELEVVPQSAPAIRFQGVSDNATFAVGDPLSGGGIVAAFGEQFTFDPPSQAGSLPLPAELGGVKVFVNDRPAPVYYASYGQVNFQVPFDVLPGPGTVRIDRGSQRGGTVSATFAAAVPKLLRLSLRASGVDVPGNRDFYAIAVNPDGTLSLPREFGIPNSRPSKPGEAIVVYGLGFGQTVPPVQSGVAAPGPPNALAQVNSGRKTVFFGALALGTGTQQEALYVGLSPGFVGLYQVNVVVPQDSPKGDVPIRVQLDTIASEFGFVAVE